MNSKYMHALGIMVISLLSVEACSTPPERNVALPPELGCLSDETARRLDFLATNQVIARLVDGNPVLFLEEPDTDREFNVDFLIFDYRERVSKVDGWLDVNKEIKAGEWLDTLHLRDSGRVIDSTIYNPFGSTPRTIYDNFTIEEGALLDVQGCVEGDTTQLVPGGWVDYEKTFFYYRMKETAR